MLRPGGILSYVHIVFGSPIHSPVDPWAGVKQWCYAYGCTRSCCYAKCMDDFQFEWISNTQAINHGGNSGAWVGASLCLVFDVTLVIHFGCQFPSLGELCLQESHMVLIPLGKGHQYSWDCDVLRLGLTWMPYNVFISWTLRSLNDFM